VIIIVSPFLYRIFGGIRPIAGDRYWDADANTTTRPQAQSDSNTIVNEYVDAVGKISVANRDNPVWWATDLASRNRFISPLSELLNDLIDFRCADDLAQASSKELIVDQPPWPIFALARETARLRNETIKVYAWPLSLLIARAGNQTRSWLSLIKGALTTFFQVRSAKKIFGHVKKIETPVYMIKSFVYANNFDIAGYHQDEFFGRLPRIISSRLKPGEKLLTVVQGFEEKDLCYRHMRELPDQWVVPIECYITAKDIVKALFECIKAILIQGFRVPRNLKIARMNASPMIHEVFAQGGWHIAFFQYLHEKAATNIAQAHKLLGCAMTFESNPWERMFIRGLQQANPTLPIYGFQHSIVTQAGIGIFLSQHEADFAPMPSAIITSGMVPLDIITRYGSYPEERIWLGGALRYETLRGVPPIPRRHNSKKKRVLVALEGVHPAAVLLDYALTQARITPEVLFIIRAHPVYPLKKMLKQLPRDRRNFSANVEVSANRSINEDVSKSDLVLYWGTTVALEAVMLGRPIVHFNRGDKLSYDPLFKLQTFHWQISRNERISTVLKIVIAMPDIEFESQRQAAVKYVKEYFLPVNDSVMSRLLTSFS
tara:strand:+ start:189 stop:1991 length:1803 start_codon:yes stop_codon:yes gene_type:complete